MIPLTRLSSVSSGRQAGRNDWANVPLDESKRGGNDEREEGGRAKGKASSTGGDNDEIPRVSRKVGRLITRWSSTSLCRDRQGQNLTGRGKDERRGWKNGRILVALILRPLLFLPATYSVHNASLVTPWPSKKNRAFNLNSCSPRWKNSERIKMFRKPKRRDKNFTFIFKNLCGHVIIIFVILVSYIWNYHYIHKYI